MDELNINDTVYLCLNRVPCKGTVVRKSGNFVWVEIFLKDKHRYEVIPAKLEHCYKDKQEFVDKLVSSL